MNSIDGDFSNMDIGRWFRNKGFEKIEFNNEKEYISTQWLVEAISFKLVKFENPRWRGRPARVLRLSE